MCIEDRVDPQKQLGVHPPKLRGKGDYAGDLRKVPCHHENEEHIAADQIFPLIKTENWYTPTIKHHCPRTAVASSLRACSNKVGFDPKVFSKYKDWFRHVFIPKFMEYLDFELWDIDMTEWLSKYNEKYRENMHKSVDPNNITTCGMCNMEYEAFTKVEMQFTTVPHDYKDTPLNDTKERQICGPCNEKKVWANAFINKLEEVASKFCKEYCGRANWIQICQSLDEINNKMKYLWGASDGSGFDMTQYPEMNELMNELLEKAANHPNVFWKEMLCKDRFIEMIRGSLLLQVSVDHGALKYEAVGRASGDGWTTFGNTMLMISYWQYTFHLAGISDYGLKVKGDDVLFAVLPKDLKKLKTAIAIVFTDKKHEHKHGLGQICKKVNYGDITDLDFLSNEFFLTDKGNLRMTRIPARVIQTNSWSTKVPPSKNEERKLRYRQELCYSKGMCLKAWADGLPIFGALADKMIELGRKGKLSEFNQYADGDRQWYAGRDDYDAYLFYLENKYSITPTEVQEIEKQIRGVQSLSGVLHMPALEKFYTPFVDERFM